MKFEVQAPPEATTPRRSLKEAFRKGLRRIEAHYDGAEGKERLATMLGRSFRWTVNATVLATGLVGVQAVLLSALLATTDDWKLLVAALHLLTAENVNNWLHHELIPDICFYLFWVWALRAGLDMLAVGFSPFYPNGLFEKRVEPAENQLPRP